MIKTQTCYTVHCDGEQPDGTKCTATIDHDFVPHYPHPEHARDEARDEFEWWCQDGVDLCEMCKLSPHVFVPEPPSGDWSCARCGLFANEHEPALTPTP
ncbi:hypothetical protein ABGB07_36190 [Micromonosporaceae bacterium B7E4]